MRIRFTAAVGLPVVDEESTQALGTLRGILINPDTGIIEGFFVRAVSGMFHHHDLFLAGRDILHWGTRITVSGADALSPIEDRVRLLPLLEKPRPMMGQTILTETGRNLGTCKDVQFDSRALKIEWLFPKRFFFWGTPVPASQIIEVRRSAIIIRDATVKAEEKAIDVGVMPSPDPA